MGALTLLYEDRRILVALKPQGVISTDEPGGMPERLRTLIGEEAGCVRAVHRLDQVVGGLMVYARSAAAASELSRQIRDHEFGKRYLAVVHGRPEAVSGSFQDLLYRSKRDRKTYVVPEMGKGVQPAELRYQLLETVGDLSLVEITLITGRTHQIRAQFAHHGLPLVGDRKYGDRNEPGDIALWSRYLLFCHPETGRQMEFSAPPPEEAPWDRFHMDIPAVPREELLDAVDQAGEPTGDLVARTVAHSLGIRHRTTHLWILRRRAGRVEVLLQKRSEEKDSFPGCYDISSAGHIPAGVDYVTSGLRELREELGLTALPEELILCGARTFTFKRSFHRRVFHDCQVSRVYALWRDLEPGDCRLQGEEVSEVRWFDYETLPELIRSHGIKSCIYLEELEMLRRAI